jgi:hypothetical protein
MYNKNCRNEDPPWLCEQHMRYHFAGKLDAQNIFLFKFGRY